MNKYTFNGRIQTFFPEGVHDQKSRDHWFMILCVQKGSDPNVHQWMNGEASRAISKRWNTIQP